MGRDAARRILTRIAIGIAAAAIVAAAIGAVLVASGSRRIAALETRLAERASHAVERPPAPANDSARELDRLSRSAGIGVTTRERARATSTMAVPPRDLSSQARDALRDRAWEPGAELAAYLAEQGPALDAMAAHLAVAPVPEWESGRAADTAPNLSALLEAQKVLLVRARRTTDAAARERDLTAAWTVAVGLLRRHDLLSQLVGMAGARLVAEALVSFDADPAIWIPRLDGLALEPCMRAALDADLAAMLAQSRGGEPTESEGAQGFLENAFVAVGFTAFGGGLLEMTDAVNRAVMATAPCEDVTAAARAATQQAGFLTRRVFADMSESQVSPWNRMRRAELELELTRRVLAARSLGDQPVGTDLTPLLGPPRIACPSFRWTEVVLPDGTMRIAVEGDLPWPTASSSPPRALNWTGRP